MKIVIYFLVVIVILLCSCQKKTSVTGVVYSRYGYAVTNVEIILSKQVGRYTDSEKIVTTTNGDGSFSFSFKSKKTEQYIVRCVCDSGNNGKYLDTGKPNNVVIKLEK